MDFKKLRISNFKSFVDPVEVNINDGLTGVVVPNGSVKGIAGLVEKPEANDAPSNLASIGRYVLTPDIFDTLHGLSAGSGGEIQLADAINIHAQQGSVEMVRLNGRRFDCGSVDGYMKACFSEFPKRKA